jgi:hypothetical protein
VPDGSDGIPEDDDGFALLAAVPLRHLRSGLEVCATRGRVGLPATGRGDLDAARPGDVVYLYAYQVGDRPVPAATWRARFVAAVEAVDGDHPDPDLSPPTWREERATPAPTPAPPSDRDPGADPDNDDPDDDLAGIGPPEVFLEVEELRELDKRDWLFTNELVPKRERRARAFVPMTPVRVRLPG